MTSTPVTTRRTRKDPAHRRADIVECATRLALTGGLHQVTLRRVAQELGVTPGLISHYFPAVEDLVAEAFADAVTRDREEIWAEVEAAMTADSPTAGVRTLLWATTEEARDHVSALWMDGWQLSFRRPAFRQSVADQMGLWTARLTDLIERGRASGELVTADPAISAVRILALVDGLSVQAALRGAVDYHHVVTLLVGVAEQELGLRPGQLDGRPGA